MPKKNSFGFFFLHVLPCPFHNITYHATLVLWALKI